MMKYLNILLTLVIVVLGFWLGKVIYEPIAFEQAKQERYQAICDRLNEIKALQMAYRNFHGKFADDFEDLVRMIEEDTFTSVSVIGNPDDTTEATVRDTSYIAVRDSLYRGVNTGYIDSIPFIPYSRYTRFKLQSDFIEKSNVRLPVFEVKAYDTSFLYDQPHQFVRRDHALKLGSMEEASYVTNCR